MVSCLLYASVCVSVLHFLSLCDFWGVNLNFTSWDWIVMMQCYFHLSDLFHHRFFLLCFAM